MLIADFLRQRRDNFIEDWALWRDCQFDSEHARELVDQVYSETIAEIESLIAQLDPTTITF